MVEEMFQKEVLYNDGHKCVPNGLNEFDFICPEYGKRFCVAFLNRHTIKGYCSCGKFIYPALYNGLNAENAEYTLSEEELQRRMKIWKKQ